MPRSAQQDGGSLSCQTAEHDVLFGLPSGPCGEASRSGQDHEFGLETARQHCRGTSAMAENSWGTTAQGLEGRISAKLLGVSSMKTIPPSCPEPESGRMYWRSLDQLAE